MFSIAFFIGLCYLRFDICLDFVRRQAEIYTRATHYMDDLEPKHKSSKTNVFRAGKRIVLA